MCLSSWADIQFSIKSIFVLSWYLWIIMSISYRAPIILFLWWCIKQKNPYLILAEILLRSSPKKYNEEGQQKYFNVPPNISINHEKNLTPDKY